MDRRLAVVRRAREWFGDRLDDLELVARQDRQEVRGWEEPAHLRAVVRRPPAERATVNERAGVITSEPAGPEAEFARSAGEPERGAQREATGLLLEAGARALERLAHGEDALTAEEALGLECLLLWYGRPAVLLGPGLAGVPPLWNLLEDQREGLELAQRAVGRIELLGHPDYDWAGTGFLCGDGVLMTARRTLELFAEQRGAGWELRPGVTAWLNFRGGYQEAPSAGCRVRCVAGVHGRYDLALLEVERPAGNGPAPVPLALATDPPARPEGAPVCLVSYPVRDARRDEPEAIARIFRDVYNVKRVQPGELRGVLTFEGVDLLRHDAGPLGHSAGAPLVDLQTAQVLGLHTGGRYLGPGAAVPLYALRDDPLLSRAGVLFASASALERQATQEQLDQIAGTRLWQEARQAIAQLHRRAFGVR